MHPIPLPWKGRSTDDHFLKFDEVRRRQREVGLECSDDDKFMPSRLSGDKELDKEGRALDATLARVHKGLWKDASVVGTFECDHCGKTRAIHSVNCNHEDLKLLHEYLAEYNPAMCGEQLIPHPGFKLADVFFTSRKLTCHTPITDSVYNASARLNIDSNMCVYCGVLNIVGLRMVFVGPLARKGVGEVWTELRCLCPGRF